MRLVGLVLIGFGLGSDRMLIVGIGIVVFLCGRRNHEEATATMGITSVQYSPSRPPDQFAGGSMSNVAIAPWAGAYQS